METLENDNVGFREKYLSKADAEGYVRVGDFAVQELGKQSKSVAAFLDGDEGQAPEYNLGNGLRFLGSSGNYSGMKLHVDDIEEFIQRVRKYYGE
ncbi:hypothetical protein L0Y69_02690 [bacterium]|nr:hypothetical protein [bacterium]